jgi:hypothetical protein
MPKRITVGGGPSRSAQAGAVGVTHAEGGQQRARRDGARLSPVAEHA